MAFFSSSRVCPRPCSAAAGSLRAAVGLAPASHRLRGRRRGVLTPPLDAHSALLGNETTLKPALRASFLLRTQENAPELLPPTGLGSRSTHFWCVLQFVIRRTLARARTLQHSPHVSNAFPRCFLTVLCARLRRSPMTRSSTSAPFQGSTGRLYCAPGVFLASGTWYFSVSVKPCLAFISALRRPMHHSHHLLADRYRGSLPLP